MADDGLAAWTRFLLKAVREGGTITVIHRADRLADLLALLGETAGSFAVRPVHAFADEPAKRVLVRAVKTGSRNETGETSGPNSIRLVFEASHVSETHISSESMSGALELVKWSERYSPAKPKSSTARAIRCQRGQFSPSCPSIMIAISTIAHLRKRFNTENTEGKREKNWRRTNHKGTKNTKENTNIT